VANVFTYNNVRGGAGTGNVNTGDVGTYVVDEQDWALSNTSTLLNVKLSTTGQNGISSGSGNGTPNLLGLTIAQDAASVPSIYMGGVLSAQAFGGFSTFSPGSWIEIYGADLASDSRSWDGSDFNGADAPTSLDGTAVTIGGKSAFIDYISPGQVNALVSSDTPIGSQQLVVRSLAGTSAAYNVTINALQPGLLAPSSFNVKGTPYSVAVLPDGNYAPAVGAIAGVASRPAKPGEIVTL
jgi:hypothetical protein